MGVTAASAGPYTNHIHRTYTDNYASTSQLSFYNQMPFLSPNQQHQSTEGDDYILFILV